MEAFVTLATNDTYSLGALVLGHSLRRVNTSKKVSVMITKEVSQGIRAQLEQVFDELIYVDVLDSRDTCNLALLDRPDLGVTFTKLHCWRLMQYTKGVFLDADTMVISNVDELFERDEFSAAPDPGWPDCFNSGVFVFKPSIETYENLLQFAIQCGSFDGGDQGLLNMYFKDWAYTDISKHLPFTYNTVSQAFYSYLPALKKFGKDVKIVHFIGEVKPWHHSYCPATGNVVVQPGSGHDAQFLKLWWNIFIEHVSPSLNPQSGGVAGQLASQHLHLQRGPSGYGPHRHQEEMSDEERYAMWERGHIDYMGKDSFDNIARKLDESIKGNGHKNGLPPTTTSGPTVNGYTPSAAGTDQTVPLLPHQKPMVPAVTAPPEKPMIGKPPEKPMITAPAKHPKELEVTAPEPSQQPLAAAQTSPSKTDSKPKATSAAVSQKPGKPGLPDKPLKIAETNKTGDKESPAAVSVKSAKPSSPEKPSKAAEAKEKHPVSPPKPAVPKTPEEKPATAAKSFVSETAFGKAAVPAKQPAVVGKLAAGKETTAAGKSTSAAAAAPTTTTAAPAATKVAPAAAAKPAPAVAAKPVPAVADKPVPAAAAKPAPAAAAKPAPAAATKPAPAAATKPAPAAAAKPAPAAEKAAPSSSAVSATPAAAQETATKKPSEGPRATAAAQKAPATAPAQAAKQKATAPAPKGKLTGRGRQK